jgi:hypothetical protein
LPKFDCQLPHFDGRADSAPLFPVQFPPRPAQAALMQDNLFFIIIYTSCPTIFLITSISNPELSELSGNRPQNLPISAHGEAALSKLEKAHVPGVSGVSEEQQNPAEGFRKDRITFI